jgi:hypothetical protein
MTYGTNVAVVRPTTSAAGYVPVQVASFTHTSGGGSGPVVIQVVDPTKIKTGNHYQITFKDTTYKINTRNVVATKSFSLRNITDDQYLVKDDTTLVVHAELPIVEGFQLSLNNAQALSLDNTKTRWNHPDVFSFNFDTFLFFFESGTPNPSDYRIVIGDVGIATSKDTSISGIKFPAKQVNFKVTNITQNKDVPFVFSEADGNDGKLSIDSTTGDAADAIYFLEQDQTGKLAYTWQFVLNLKGERNPQAGDTLGIYLNKPYLSYDTYDFTMKGSAISTTNATNDLAKIRVVPNPYIAAETWEPRNTYTSGRGPREIHFINLPFKCTIRIFNVAGALVKKIDHDVSIENGTEIWDVLSDEKFEISYGIYVYYISAPGIGQKTGTFAIVK